MQRTHDEFQMTNFSPNFKANFISNFKANFGLNFKSVFKSAISNSLLLPSVPPPRSPCLRWWVRIISTQVYTSDRQVIL